MQTYSQDISDALQQHGHCLLPDIGLLHIIRNVAKRSYQENKLYPPSLGIMLNPFLRPDPSLYPITRQIAFSHSLSDEEAGRKWSEAAAAIRDKLSTGSSVELPGLGYLNLNEKGRISFTASQDFLSLYEAVPGGNARPAENAAAAEPAPEAAVEGTAAPAARAEEIEASAVAGPAIKVFEETGSRPRRARWWIAGSIVVLLLTGWFTYRGTILRKKKATTIRHIIRRENKTKGLASMDSLKLRQDTDSIAHAALAEGKGDDSIRYDIVFAIYNSRDRAEHQFTRMKGWGHPVVLIRRDSSLYELGLPFTSLPADTAANLEKMKTLYGKRVHIEYQPAP